MSNKSAASTCSTNSSGTLPAAAHSSPGSTHPSRSPEESHVIQSVPNVQLSINVTTRDTLANFVAGCFVKVAASQFLVTATGSAMPLNSTIIASKGRLPLSVTISTLVNNSSAKEQQAHPFCNSTVSPASLEISLLSMFTDATSFTITPMRTPSLFSNKCFNVDVLPDPKNPANNVIGIASILPPSVISVLVILVLIFKSLPTPTLCQPSDNGDEKPIEEDTTNGARELVILLLDDIILRSNMLEKATTFLLLLRPAYTRNNDDEHINTIVIAITTDFKCLCKPLPCIILKLLNN
mmetsp:Transcript_11473/g.10988  ORF Transcript_11473/g.10988 Transcript_11473/m.10988 type:complete len:295 (-) Transcript_11473:69-953(-)